MPFHDPVGRTTIVSVTSREPFARTMMSEWNDAISSVRPERLPVDW